MSEYRTLVARLNRTLDDLAILADRTAVWLDRARGTGDEVYLHAAALDLHGFYTGAEQAFEAIARAVDGSVPQSAGWHRELLVQMASEIPGVRPAVLGGETETCLDAYRAFRHVVRNVYTLNLDPTRVRDLADGLRDCLARLRSDMAAFVAFLEALGVGG